MNIFFIMIVSLFCTLMIELLFSFIFGIREKKDFFNIALVNILTNPLVVSISFFVNIVYGLFYRRVIIIILEIVAIIVEGFIYRKYLSYKKINGYVLSILLNVLSYGLGIIINNIIY